MQIIYYEEPDPITYVPLEDGQAEVWLRKNTRESRDIIDLPCLECDEVYMVTELSKEEVEARFDELFTKLLRSEDPQLAAEDRINDLQAQIEEQAGAIEELASMLAGGE